MWHLFLDISLWRGERLNISAYKANLRVPYWGLLLLFILNMWSRVKIISMLPLKPKKASETSALLMFRERFSSPRKRWGAKEKSIVDIYVWAFLPKFFSTIVFTIYDESVLLVVLRLKSPILSPNSPRYFQR